LRHIMLMMNLINIKVLGLNLLYWYLFQFLEMLYFLVFPLSFWMNLLGYLLIFNNRIIPMHLHLHILSLHKRYCPLDFQVLGQPHPYLFVKRNSYSHLMNNFKRCLFFNKLDLPIYLVFILVFRLFPSYLTI
jgi:hypothetical protein